MSVAIGARLGPYEVIALLGVGGMGEVYRARDTRLDRTVAIKVLPALVSADPERRARFEREARTIAGLTHPHICTLYDVGSTNSPPASPGQGPSTDSAHASLYLVMELLEGETLAARLARGPLPLAQALEVGAEVADALAAAHRQGVIHRDLKPGNVMLTKSGAKLLDFGLAKLMDRGPEHAASDPAAAVTQPAPITGEGTIVGTLPYMAPEQLEGKPTDVRTDLWALGTLLYEMVTGKCAFEGTSAASLIANIMHAEPPPPSTLQPVTPPALDRLVKRCLAKSSDDRWESARDAADELRWLRDGGAGAAVTDAPRARGRRWRLAWIAGVGLATLLVGAFVGGRFLVPRQDTTLEHLRKFRLSVGNTDQAALFLTGAAISPDGMRVAYTLSDGLWVQDLDRLEPPRRVHDSEGAAQPFWSPDGTSIGFFDLTTLTLMRVPAEGGTAQKISAVPRPNVGGGAWGRNGTIYFACRAGWASRGGGGLYEVAADGGAAVLRAAPREDEVGFTSPLVLQDTGDVLAVLATTKGRRHVVRISGASSVQILDVTHAGSSVVLAHARPRHLLYGSPAGLWAVALHHTRTPLQASGQPVRIAEEGNRPSVSDDGQLLYVPKPEAARRLVWVNRRGEVVGTIGQAQSSITEPALSPDGTRVAVRGTEGGKTDIWIHDAARGTKTRLTSEPGSLSQPCWTANGRDLVYVDDQGRSEGRIVARRADGGDRPRVLVNTPVVLYEPDVSRDGRFGVFVAHDPDRNMFTDLWYAELEGTGKAMPFEESPFTKLRPHISPDGRYVAYSSNEGNAHQIYVRSFPTGEGKWTISTQGGTSPRWSRDGRTLYFVKGNSLVAVSIDTGRDLRVGPPVELFLGARVGAVLFSPESPYDLRYDVAADEQRFVVVQSVLSPLAGLALVENWASALARPGEKTGGAK